MKGDKKSIKEIESEVSKHNSKTCYFSEFFNYLKKKKTIDLAVSNYKTCSRELPSGLNIENSDPEIVPLLIDHGANVKKYGRKLGENEKHRKTKVKIGLAKSTVVFVCISYDDEGNQIIKELNGDKKPETDKIITDLIGTYDNYGKLAIV